MPSGSPALLFVGGFASDLSSDNGFSQESILQRDADLLHLWTVYTRAAPGAPKAEALARFSEETSRRARVDGAVRAVSRDLLEQPSILVSLQVVDLLPEIHIRLSLSL